jgi:ferric-dicitrate binding protein FerR (iron transport regulator)
VEGWRGGETEKRRDGETERWRTERGEKAERVRRFEQGIDYLQQCEIMEMERQLERICGSKERLRHGWLGLHSCQDCRQIL